jgi:hypothetical protein
LTEQDNIFLAHQQLATAFNISLVSSQSAWLSQLAAAVNHLIQTDFNGLVNILYRLDVSEARLKEVLRQQPDTDAGELIANMMVERQLRKMADRERFTAPNDIPDDEKW